MTREERAELRAEAVFEDGYWPDIVLMLLDALDACEAERDEAELTQVGWAMPRKNGPFKHLHDANLALYSEKEPWWDEPIPVFVIAGYEPDPALSMTEDEYNARNP